MRRRTLVIGLLAIGLAPAAIAQPGVRPVRIAYLTGYSAEVDQPLMAAFRRGLSEHGYIEGRNLIIDARYAAGEVDTFPAMAQQLAVLKPDLFVVLGDHA